MLAALPLPAGRRALHAAVLVTAGAGAFVAAGTILRGFVPNEVARMLRKPPVRAS